MAFFQRLSPHLVAADVTVAFEFLGPQEKKFINTAAETIELLKRIDSPNVRLHLDLKAITTDSKPIPEIVRDSLPWTAHFHAPTRIFAVREWITYRGSDFFANESMRHLRNAFGR